MKAACGALCWSVDVDAACGLVVWTCFRTDVISGANSVPAHSWAVSPWLQQHRIMRKSIVWWPWCCWVKHCSASSDCLVWCVCPGQILRGILLRFGSLTLSWFNQIYIFLYHSGGVYINTSSKKYKSSSQPWVHFFPPFLSFLHFLTVFLYYAFCSCCCFQQSYCSPCRRLEIGQAL